jgi:hypothetical protein
MKRLSLMILLIFISSCIYFQNPGHGNDDVIVDSNISELNPRQISIDPLSARPLYLIQIKANEPLGTATGFIVEKENKNFLITNWHVVSGRNPQSGETLNSEGKTPDALLIWHHGERLGTWKRKREMLIDDQGNKKWIEHKKGKMIDIAALPLQNDSDDIKIYPLDLSLAEVNMVPEVAMPVSIIGFPVGLTSAGFFPIWKTGHIASEPNLDHQNEPLFLIDATTRGGMSGSPVVLRMSGGYKTREGNTIMSSSGYRTRFLGIYSGRLPRDSEIGRVWRPELINEILN